MTIFLVNAIHSTIFDVSLQNLYQISISLIARMSLKLGKIRTETTVGHGGQNGPLSAIIFFKCVISGKPDQVLGRPLL